MKSSKIQPLSPIMERHTPQHPLPDELKQMSKDATVCQFCGVSYLIHHEIKNLEDKVKYLEGQLEYLEGSAEREDKVKHELEDQKKKMVSVNCLLSEKDLMIENITNEIQDLKLTCGNMRNQLNVEMENKNNIAQKFCSFKLKTTATLKSFQHETKTMKEILSRVKADIAPLKTQSVQFTDEMNSILLDFARKCREEFNSTMSEKKNFAAENISLQQKINILKSEALENKNKIDNLFSDDAKRKLHADQEIENMVRKIQQLEQINTDQSQSLKSSEAKFRALQSEQVLLQDKLRKKQTDTQSAIVKLQKTEENANLTIQRLTQESRQLERELSSANKRLEGEINSQKERERKERQMKERVNLGVGKLDEMEKVVQETKDTCKTLINERELMITSHQNQIHQLRENFKKKLEEIESNPAHSQNQLREVQQRHQADVLALREKMNEEFGISMSVEKDKHSESMLDLKNKHRQEIKQMQEHSEDELESYKHKVNALNQRVEIMERNMNVSKDEFTEEKTSLKKIISNLEGRIADLNANQEDSNSMQKIQLGNLKEKFEHLETKNEKLERELLSSKEEITLLQETVRKECEERFELTEALSAATERLRTSKTTNGAINNHTQVPISALNRVNSTGNTDKDSIKLSNQTLRNLGLDHPSPRGLPSLRSLPDLLPRREIAAVITTSPSQDIPTHVRDLSFPSNDSSAKRSHSCGSNGGNLTSTLPYQNGTQPTKHIDSVDNVRRRIAAAIKRK